MEKIKVNNYKDEKASTLICSADSYEKGEVEGGLVRKNLSLQHSSKKVLAGVECSFQAKVSCQNCSSCCRNGPLLSSLQ